MAATRKAETTWMSTSSIPHVTKVNVKHDYHHQQHQQQQPPPPVVRPKVMAPPPSSSTSSASSKVPETPAPDYDDESPGGAPARQRNSFNFVNNFRHIISNIRTIEELQSNFPEPAPDYNNEDDDTSPTSSNGGDFPPPPPPLTAEELATAVSEAYETQVANGVSPTAPEGEDEAPAQIRPKPLHNPCVESKERQALHKELLLNYKIGKDVLQKPELNKVLRERRETQKKKEWEQHQANSRTSLELKLQQRRHKEDEESKMNAIEEDDSATPEYLRMHKKITHKVAGESS